MAAGRGVVGRDADQAVHTGFGLQPAIGIGAADLHGDGFDARLLAFGHIEDFDLEAARLGPAHVHALEHLRPVLRLGAAGASVDFHEGIAAIGLAGEQAFNFPAFGLFGEAGERRDGVLHHRRIALGFGKLDEFQRVGGFALQRAHAVNQRSNTAAFAHHCLRGFGVVP